MILLDYETKIGRNCIIGNVRNMLKYYHVDVDEEDLFFWFCPFKGDMYLENVFEDLYEENDKKNWIEYVVEKLKCGSPVFISIDPKVIPYVNIEVGNPSTSHYIVINGIDLDKGTICVSDSYIPTFKPNVFKGWIEYKDLEKGIGKCWSLKENAVLFFKEKCSRNEIDRFTYYTATHRLSRFLNQRDLLSNKIEKICNYVEKKEYNEVLSELAGVRLWVINSLNYLLDILDRDEKNRQDSERIQELVKNGWEKVNINLIKFAIAHKKLDSNEMLYSFNTIIQEEWSVLESVLMSFREKQYDSIVSNIEKNVVAFEK